MWASQHGVERTQTASGWLCCLSEQPAPQGKARPAWCILVCIPFIAEMGHLRALWLMLFIAPHNGQHAEMEDSLKLVACFCKLFLYGIFKRQKHEGGNWFGVLEGGVHCMAYELEHDFIIVWRMAEEAATVAHREGICACPIDLVAVNCATISIIGTVKLKR
eukprot:scaffold304983_cov19-Tisochrysis_lutea.AAC.1